MGMLALFDVDAVAMVLVLGGIEAQAVTMSVTSFDTCGTCRIVFAGTDPPSIDGRTSMQWRSAGILAVLTKTRLFLNSLSFFFRL